MGNSPIVSRINSLLAEKGIEKKEFYKNCGITSASYSLWNTGKTKPRMKNLETIANYLGVPVSYLLEGKEQKEKPPVDDERFLPLAERREALSKAGIHILLDADAKVTEEQLDDILSFIEIQQRRNGR